MKKILSFWKVLIKYWIRLHVVIQKSPLRWSSKSIVKLGKELREMGHSISANTVPVLLKELGYSLQSNLKTREGGNHEDRDRQFLFIKEQVELFQEKNQLSSKTLIFRLVNRQPL
ncbi:MAG TPA: hypothetical protein DCQ14_03070 [Firmicutes bacterium]|nr:hypothetical protein [Bacillota bacterium]